jgi:MOSC domain-containing protein YiiM
VAAVHRSERHGFSKQARESIRLIAGWGVDGDAHAGRSDQHLFHIRRFGEQPNLRQVHLIASELLDELRALGHAVAPGELGENITTRGVDLLALPEGTRLRIGGEAVVELTGLRNPCRQIETFQAGLLARLVEQRPEGLVRKAGVMGIVVHGGTVQPGDAVQVDLPPAPHRPLVYRAPAPRSARPA